MLPPFMTASSSFQLLRLEIAAVVLHIATGVPTAETAIAAPAGADR
jgi:hypothetical protein